MVVERGPVAVESLDRVRLDRLLGISWGGAGPAGAGTRLLAEIPYG
jgi:hypothetical protein